MKKSKKGKKGKTEKGQNIPLPLITYGTYALKANKGLRFG
jgi:hypothetical protein